MRKLLPVLMAITMIISTNGSAFAAFTVIGSKSFDAEVLVGGDAGVIVGFSASLNNLSDDGAASNISWSSIDAGSTSWKAANQYISVKGFANYSDWGIQVYTNNDGYTGTGNPAGLVRKDDTKFSLPMCWRTKVGYYQDTTDEADKSGSAAVEESELEINQGTIKTDDGKSVTVLYDGAIGHEPNGENEYFPWFFITDKSADDIDPNEKGKQTFGNYQQDATFLGSEGYHHAPGDVAINFATPSHPKDTYYIYLGAQFVLSVPGKTYSTDTLTVEMYHL